MDVILQLVTASLTILSVWMAGNGDQRFNWLGLFNQVLWVIVLVRAETYGLLLLTVAMTFVYTRNLVKNRKVLLGAL